MSKFIKLSELPVGCWGKIIEVSSQGLSKQRLLDIGIIPGSKIYVLRKSFSGDPTAYIIRDTTIALRKEETSNISVIKI
ncbi:ferrous iron transport protein A [Haloimpatiens sp. FM7330]|uniref:FeoA family protein n=1 Tax=Haloimpatiens sp. FM7330 TaxID=3298610 RepID=UPI003640A3A2